ncbi:MAG: hypothetical protein ACUVXD_15390, partial [Thermodesulfobacteriota bacterium]
ITATPRGTRARPPPPRAGPPGPSRRGPTIGNLVPFMSHVGLRALPAVILGGMNSVTGAIVGGLILGVCENLAGTYIAPKLGGGDIKEITSYVIVLIVMMIRPYGLFGTKEIERV